MKIYRPVLRYAASRIETAGDPPAFTLKILMKHATGKMDPNSIGAWLDNRKNRRAIPHRLEPCGYVSYGSDAPDGLWVVAGKRQVIYVQKNLDNKAKLDARRKLQRENFKI